MNYKPATPDKIRFAVIGCGHIGTRHAIQIARFGILAAVCDPVADRRDTLAGRYGARAYADLESLLGKESGNIDVAVICTPNYLHAPQSIAALETGCHVLCEKPMSIHYADAAAMIACADRTGRHLFIVKQNRFNPPILLLQTLLSEQRLGKIHSFQVNCFWSRPASYYSTSGWRGKKELDGGVLLTQFSHFIDLLCWLFGDLRTVGAYRDNFLLKDLLDGEDTGCAILRMQDGSIGTLHYTITAYDQNMEGSITVFGEKGTVKIGGQYLNELEYFCVRGMQAPALQASRPANDYGLYTGSMSNHDKVYEELIKALQGRPYELPSANEAAQTVLLIEKIRAASGRP
ncbi:MAG: Gfo/Idh/MocA family oxidoreductase [Puia sp.]|nr:Gfo/Idh/MocA family oxidoreductase [Puia sp.]